MISIAKYEAVERIRSGRSITVRAIRPEDKELLRDAFEKLDDHSLRLRFFGLKKELTDHELIQATEIDFVSNVALACCDAQDGKERIIGIGRYITDSASAPGAVAEIAFVVASDFQGQGIASILLRHLALIGQDQGISQFKAEVLPANTAMLRVFERSGRPVEKRSTVDSIHVTMSLLHQARFDESRVPPEDSINGHAASVSSIGQSPCSTGVIFRP